MQLNAYFVNGVILIPAIRTIVSQLVFFVRLVAFVNAKLLEIMLRLIKRGLVFLKMRIRLLPKWPTMMG